MTKKSITLVYSEPTGSHFYLNGNLCHLAKIIDGISTGVAPQLK